MRGPIRLAIIVSHPIQYYAPLYQRLALRTDLVLKVFFTWHAGEKGVVDHGFKKVIAWDISLTDGYESELVPNVASDPGTHHFLGVRNPSLIARVVSWLPDVVHITGWALYSHLFALRSLASRGIPILFRGDSHLLDTVMRNPRWWIKRTFLRHIYTWPTSFLFVGQANRAYYKALGVEESRLLQCPHSIDVGRFSQNVESCERQANEWRLSLGIKEGRFALLFAGKFEKKKQPLELIKAFLSLNDQRWVLIMVGNGELEEQVYRLADAESDRIKVLPFQNQSRMPVVYRLGDLFILPSAYGETWGLGVNEALASGRPVVVSDRVGCAADVVTDSCGTVFNPDDPDGLSRTLAEMTQKPEELMKMREAATAQAWRFDVGVTERSLVHAIREVCS